MSHHGARVVIVGIGNVGATTAYSLINQELCEEVILIDPKPEKADAQALDMEHAVYFLNRNIRIRAGDYPDCAGADIVVIAASAPMPKDATTRMEMLAPSIGAVTAVVQSVMAAGFNGIFVIVSNPVDVMTHLVWKLSGLPAAQVIGSGTALDTARLCCELGKLYDLDAKSVDAYILGEHGDTEMLAWTCTEIGGKKLNDVMRDNRERTQNVTRESLLEQTKQAGWQIFRGKGNTCYGIASTVTAIIKAILFDEDRILPVSTLVNGSYGIDGVFLSVPVILNGSGVKETVEIRLSKEELRELQASANALREVCSQLKL